MCTHCLYRTCTSCAICSSLARRDRSSSGSRSVRFRLEIGRVPHRDRSSSTLRSVTTHHRAPNRRPPPPPRNTVEPKRAGPRPDSHSSFNTEHENRQEKRRENAPTSQPSSIQPMQSSYMPTAPLIRSSTVPNDIRQEVRHDTPTRSSQAKPGTKTNRSRAGSGPISRRSATDLGETTGRTSLNIGRAHYMEP